MTLRIGVAGLGTVGAGVLRLLQENAAVVTARAGRPIAVTAVSARDRKRDRGVALAGLRWLDDPVALATDPDVDVVVELIGGSDGPAKELAQAAIACGTPATVVGEFVAPPGLEVRLDGRRLTPTRLGWRHG